MKSLWNLKSFYNTNYLYTFFFFNYFYLLKKNNLIFYIKINLFLNLKNKLFNFNLKNQKNNELNFKNLNESFKNNFLFNKNEKIFANLNTFNSQKFFFSRDNLNNSYFYISKKKIYYTLIDFFFANLFFDSKSLFKNTEFFKFFFFKSTKGSPLILNVNKLLLRWVDFTNFVTNLYFYNLNSLFFSSPFFKNEVLSLN